MNITLPALDDGQGIPGGSKSGMPLQAVAKASFCVGKISCLEAREGQIVDQVRVAGSQFIGPE